VKGGDFRNESFVHGANGSDFACVESLCDLPLPWFAEGCFPKILFLLMVQPLIGFVFFPSFKKFLCKSGEFCNSARLLGADESHFARESEVSLILHFFVSSKIASLGHYSIQVFQRSCQAVSYLFFFL
jgi:hypothetical protein